MRIIVVDDETGARNLLCAAINRVVDDAEIRTYSRARTALEEAEEFRPHVAFLDIQMPGMNGVELAVELQKDNPTLNIIFATGYDDYALDAFKSRASGYLLKPVRSTDVARELSNLRHPVEDSSSGLYAKTFGNFELFYKETPVHFKYEKSREMFAYLFDRNGSMISNNAMMAVLWEDEGHESYFRQLKKDLVDTLSEVGCADVVLRRRGYTGLDCKRIESDLYERNEGKPITTSVPYNGEYMAQYSWAEYTNATLL